MWRLFCRHLLLISPSFGALGRVCFVLVAFLGYLHERISDVVSIYLPTQSAFYVNLYRAVIGPSG